jgi:hypothetical protein
MNNVGVGGSSIGDFYREHATEDYTRAAGFATRHVHKPSDYESYYSDVLLQWEEDAEDALEQDKPTPTMWVRRNNEDTNEFSSCVDYLVPTDDSFRYYATLVVDSDGGHTEIEVLLHSDDGSGEPVTVSREPYGMESLDRAIKLVEAQYSTMPNHTA